MTDHFQEIYARHADRYEALVSREDYQGNILTALEDIRRLEGLDVVEFGAGTGRLTLMLAPRVRRIHAYDGSAHMLTVTVSRLSALGLTNWRAEVADNRALPEPDQSADLAIQGWSFGHFCGWYPDSWRKEIGRAVGEMTRILRPGGTAIILETLGTGRETPWPPSPALAEYYTWLESDHGFTRTWIRTDYRFESLAEAEDVAGFFFGPEMAEQIRANNWLILPECTGIWHKSV